MTNKKREVQFVLLVEDKLTQRVITSVLKSFGFSSNKFRISRAPDGDGSAKKWVTDQYPDFVKKHQSQSHQKNLVLIVGTDADEQIVEQRIKDLVKSLSESAVSDRTANDKIVLWIPRWNIETWVLHLAEEDVSEEDKETKQQVKKLKPNYKVIGEEFVTRYRKFINEEISDALPSLQSAFDETKQRML